MTKTFKNVLALGKARKKFCAPTSIWGPILAQNFFRFSLNKDKSVSTLTEKNGNIKLSTP